MAKFVIENGIKIPAETPSAGRNMFYPFSGYAERLQFCSFFWPMPPCGHAKPRRTFSQRHPEFKFTSRKTPDGVRIWRV